MDLGFSWVIDGKLGGSAGPRSKSDLIVLKNYGVRALVRLVEADHSMVTTDEIHEVGLEDYNEQVPDFTAPTQDQIGKIIVYIDSHLEAGVPVGVSCNRGIGRTGVILACYLVHKGMTAEDALELVRRRRGRGLELPEQTVAVEVYSAVEVSRSRSSRKSGRVTGYEKGPLP